MADEPKPNAAKPELATPLGTPPTNIPSNTTPEEDRMTAGQRRVNIIWELTQAAIAIATTGTGMIVSALLALRAEFGAGQVAAVAAFVFLTSAVNLVIGFYFGRTNHARQGGVGGSTKEADR